MFNGSKPMFTDNWHDYVLNIPHCDCMFGVLGLLGQVCLKCFRAARGQQKESESSVWMNDSNVSGRDGSTGGILVPSWGHPRPCYLGLLVEWTGQIQSHPLNIAPQYRVLHPSEMASLMCFFRLPSHSVPPPPYNGSTTRLQTPPALLSSPPGDHHPGHHGVDLDLQNVVEVSNESDHPGSQSQGASLGS